MGAQPVEPDSLFLPADLVEVITLDSTIRVRMPYATADNFMHRVMYASERAFLQRPVAQDLLRAHRALQALGYGIVIYDAYRPWSVTKAFWDETPPEKRNFVANPANGSVHNRGGAVDIGLVDPATGREVEMPSGYDEFTERAASGYPGGTAEQRRNRDLLIRIMAEHGFHVIPDEWWHFDHVDARRYKVMNIPFDAIH